MYTPYILYIFAVAVIGGLMVRRAYLLQSSYGLPYLHYYTFFLVSWNAYVLFSIFQMILAPRFLLAGTWSQFAQAATPQFIIIMAVSLYYLSSLSRPAQLLHPEPADQEAMTLFPVLRGRAQPRS